MADLRLSMLPQLSDVHQSDARVPVVQGGVTYMASPRALQAEGWANYVDSQYTVGSPLVVNANRVKLTINGLGATTNTAYLPHGVTQLWNTVTSKITPENIGDCYDVRVTMTVKANAKDAYFDVQLDIGGTIGLAAQQTVIVPKVAFTPVKLSLSVPIFTLGTFVANGGELFIDATDSGAVLDVYDIAVFIKREYAAL